MNTFSVAPEYLQHAPHSNPTLLTPCQGEGEEGEEEGWGKRRGEIQGQFVGTKPAAADSRILPAGEKQPPSPLIT